ncbi:hypothetical protein B0H19DRAFT_1057234 [Mycena capillaripes]|nr:hypothetical protein B0H19DRAFT_1057234 [Mycena capillaripes]
MCDERTASKMAAWSTAKRNGLAADYIINMGILEKYWKYGFNTSNVYTHTSRLTLDNFDETTAPPTRILPAPTLPDLLNPIPLAPNPSEGTLFDNPDPYGHKALEDDDDDDAPDENAEPSIIMCSSDARRLAIETCQSRGTGSFGSSKPPRCDEAIRGHFGRSKHPRRSSEGKWNPKNASWGKESGGW